MKIRFFNARYISFLLVICLMMVFALPGNEVFAKEYVIDYRGGRQTDVYTDDSRIINAGYSREDMSWVTDLSGDYIVNYVGSPDATFWVSNARSAIMFDMRDIYGDVVSAALEIYVVDSEGDPYVHLYGADDSFYELNGASSFPVNYEGNMITRGDTDIHAGSWKTFDVTDFVKDKIDIYSPTVTFVLTGNPLVSEEDHYFNFVSDNDPLHTNLRPVLRLEVEPTVPGKPTNVSAVADNGKATVSFTPPISNGGEEITDYIVTPYKNGVAETDKEVAKNENPIKVMGLTNGATYTFTVRAKNSIGTGEESDASSPVTPDTLPEAPTITNVTASIETATITFSEPFNEGSTITSYKVTPYIEGTPQNDKITTGAVSPITVTGLTGGTTYTFKVSAINGKGEGPISEASEPVKVTALPGKPTGVTVVRGNGEVEVTFVAPVFDGGSAITSYKVTPYEGSTPLTSTEVPAAPSPMTVTVTGLTNGTTYTIRVSAITDVGEGPESDASAAVTSATVPEAPTEVTGERGDGKATVRFTAPSSNGGSPITQYLVTANPGGHTATGAGSAITVTGLTNGEVYTFTVIAINDVGMSEPSAPSLPVTPATVPSAPINVHAEKAGDGKVSVSFTNPASDGGSTITAYKVTPYIGTVP